MLIKTFRTIAFIMNTICSTIVDKNTIMKFIVL